MIKYYFYTLQIFVIGYFCATVPENLFDVRTLLLAGIFGSIAAVLLMLVILQLEGATNWLSFKRVSISFGLIDFNAVGGVTAANAVALLGLYIKRQTRRSAALGIILLLIILVLTRSRGAWLGFGIAFLYLFFRTRSFELTVTGGLAGVIIIVTDFLRNVFTTRIEATSVGDPALAGRLVLWEFAWRVAKANWLFGVGWENFRLIKPLYGFPAKLVRNWTDYNAHNIFLEIMADLGIVGLVLFLGLSLMTLIQLDRCVREKNSISQGLGLALNAAMICFLVHGVWDCLSYTFLVLGIWVGLAMALVRITNSRESARPI
ncbi:MAG: O-antigen ligase family protein [bacterium]